MRRCRAAAAPDRLGFHLAQAVGVALQWSSPQVRMVVPVPSQNFIRSRNLGHYRSKCGPKQDRNLNSLFGRENSLFFAETSLFTPKNSLLVPPGDPILSRPGFISLHGPSESRTSGTTKP